MLEASRETHVETVLCYENIHCNILRNPQSSIFEV